MKTIPHLLIYLLLAGAGLDACSPSQSKEGPPPEEPIAVRVSPVSSKATATPIVVSGTIASKKEAKLSFKTGGILARLAAEEGQTVRKGQLLASLNLTEINAQASQARENGEKARRDLERAKRLYADSAATYEQLQNATTGFEVASAGQNIAQFNLQHSRIYAPQNGRILKRFSEEGEIVGPGMPVFTFAASGKDQWIVRVGVADRDMVRLQSGDHATVTLDAHPGTAFTATVTEIAQTADPRNGTFEVELQIEPQGKQLASGMVAQLTIQPSNGPALVTVPIEALVEADGDQGYVYALNADRRTVRKLPVKVALLLNQTVALSSGLKVNDTIITDGVAYLTPNARVRVVK